MAMTLPWETIAAKIRSRKAPISPE
jgi:hypothetical protein